MTKPSIRVAVTGGAGQIAYQLLFRIASGEVFGPNRTVRLSLLEIPDLLPALEGIKMELNDCAFPLLQSIETTSDPYRAFKDADFALLVGAKPRGPGMERRDLLRDNGKIFVEQGRALNEAADRNVRVFVVGNPCNTNCLIAMHHAPDLPPQHFYAMTRLDQNRATFFLAEKAGVPNTDVSDLVIWGNHSSTQVPDFLHARIGDLPVKEVIKDLRWLENDFIDLVRNRGAAVIKVRGKSSAGSAANALIDAIKDVLHPTKRGKLYSCGVISDGNPYEVEDGLIFSFPCFTSEIGEVAIFKGLENDEFLIRAIKESEKELAEERLFVESLMKPRS